MRPLDRLGSIKLKLGAVIVAAVLVTVGVLELGRGAGWPTVPVAAIALVAALGMVQVLAHGMTFPLRQMARAASRLAAGERHDPVTATSRDEVGELARAFNRMADEVSETDRLRRDLVANVSHELRTPIAALRAVVENLVDGVEEPDPATLDGVLRQVDRLQALVQTLLDLSRLDAGVAHLQTAPVAAAELFDDAIAMLAGRPDPEVVSVVDPPELTVVADGRRLLQVVVNLLDNAQRHAPTGSEIRLEAFGRADRVELSVTDAGPGIDPTQAERVFERFQRGDDGRPDPSGGSGLGLSISRWIVELHGGRLMVDGSHAPGCRMVVTLPHLLAPALEPPTDHPQEQTHG